MKYSYQTEKEVLVAASKIMEARAKRYRSVIDSSGAAKSVILDCLCTLLCDEEREHFVVLFLSSSHCLIAKEVMFSGSINSSSVWPREVVKRALELNAAAVIISHNHPSGEVEPSDSDIQLTSRIKDALELVSVTLLDHIIVGAGKHLSFGERGLLRL